MEKSGQRAGSERRLPAAPSSDLIRARLGTRVWGILYMTPDLRYVGTGVHGQAVRHYVCPVASANPRVRALPHHEGAIGRSADVTWRSKQTRYKDVTTVVLIHSPNAPVRNAGLSFRWLSTFATAGTRHRSRTNIARSRGARAEWGPFVGHTAWCSGQSPPPASRRAQLNAAVGQSSGALDIVAEGAHHGTSKASKFAATPSPPSS